MVRTNLTKKNLIDFELKIANLWEKGLIPYPVHLTGGNEEKLIEIFNSINNEDYVFSTHRSHYHYLLANGSENKLEEMILRGDSMHVFDRDINFLTSAIVSGTPTIAAGVALGIKKLNKKNHVWCFVGDGAEDEGHFYEAVRYVDGHYLPCTFVLEDNNRSVETPKNERYGKSKINWPECVLRYEYESTVPHVGTGKFVKLGDINVGGPSF